MRIRRENASNGLTVPCWHDFAMVMTVTIKSANNNDDWHWEGVSQRWQPGAPHDSHAKWRLVVMHHTKRMRAALRTLAVVVKARGLRLRQQQKRQMGSAHYGCKIMAIHESVPVTKHGNSRLTSQPIFIQCQALWPREKLGQIRVARWTSNSIVQGWGGGGSRVAMTATTTLERLRET